MGDSFRRGIPAAAVGIGAIVLWLIGGVQPGDVLRYLAYEAVFVVAPGWLLVRAIAPSIRSRTWQLGLAWPIGLTVEILAFSLTAGLDARDLFLVYPLAVGIPAALVAHRRARALAAPDAKPVPLFSAAARWALVGLCLLAFAYLGTYYTLTPLPGTAPGVVYPPDNMAQISISASALHGWPPSDWRVAGEPFGYHYFAFFHFAAISQVTGVDLPLILLRLAVIPLTVLLILELALAGRLFSDRVWAGSLTAALFLLVREIDLSIRQPFPFGEPSGMWTSPSQLLGIALFIAVLIVLGCLLDSALLARVSSAPRMRRRELWAVLALLLVGAGGAKSPILPMLIVGLILYLGYWWVSHHRLDRVALGALGLCASLFVVYYALIYHGTSAGMRLDPPGSLVQMPSLDLIHAIWPGGALAATGYWALAAPFGIAMYFAAPLLGLGLWLWRRPPLSIEPAAALSISLVVVGFGCFLFLREDFYANAYFVQFGLAAGMPFAAAGLLQFFGKNFGRPELNPRRVAACGAAWLIAMVIIALLADRQTFGGHPLRADLLAYGPVLLVITGLALMVLISAGARKRFLQASLVLVVMLTAALDAPLDVIPPIVRQIDAGGPLYASSPRGLRPEEYAGMVWIRDHAPSDAVLAVSNDLTPDTLGLGPLDAEYPAFTEHRTFREGWDYTARAGSIGKAVVGGGIVDPFPERTSLEQAVFAEGDREALRIMVRKYHVTDLMISKIDGVASPRTYRLGRLVYSNGAVDVIRVR